MLPNTAKKSYNEVGNNKIQQGANMAKVEIYTGEHCPHCVRAKDLLKRKGVEFIEIRVDNDVDKRSEMLAKSNGKRTIPQIFIDGVHIGGCDDLYALDSAGKLDSMLKGTGGTAGSKPEVA